MDDQLERTQTIQREVADPRRSAWVSANAGTGKTYVLVRRVVRQLLAGARPQSIVCITYTKTAAAEMSSRLLGMLIEWSLMADDKLSEAIRDVTGEVPSAEDRENARRLFAIALESPGGLKIQTIHSFCSSLLARFPAEAGLPLGFRPLEDDQAAQMMREAVAKTAAVFADGDTLTEHLNALTDRFQGDDQLTSFGQRTLESILSEYARKMRAIKLQGIRSGTISEVLAKGTGAHPNDSAESLVKKWYAGVDHHFMRELITICSQATGKTMPKLGEDLQKMIQCPSVETLFIKPAMLSAGADKPKNLTKSVRDLLSSPDAWERQCTHLMHYRDRWLALESYNENISLFLTSEAVLRTYAAEKQRLAMLDYEDLIYKTLELLRKTSSSWIRYKLDQGIDHILIDEAQDNSSSQWQVFHQLAEELVATDHEAAGSDRLRSIFVVGDPKQSIYAFQGAEAGLFNQTRSFYLERSGHGLISRQLFLSFRTSQPVLDVVDAAFDNEAFRVVAGDYHRHEAKHSDRPGSVELWPHIEWEKKEHISLFEAHKESDCTDSLDVIAANRIAKDIQRRLRDKKPLASKDGEEIEPRHIMVLFQRRGRRFTELLRALQHHGVPCAGTDRVYVGEDQAVHDLKSLLRFAANTDDSLSLAETLKSPFLGWSEDQLFDLCSERTEEVLWRELSSRAGQEDELSHLCAAARARLQSALDLGARHGPYALLASMLESDGDVTGRWRLSERLGTSYRDAVEAFVDAALAFEESEPRSIHHFLQHAETLAANIKREIQDSESSGVRVMTVHGAKGLEAPVVYLADADYRKASSKLFQSNPFAEFHDERLSVSMPILLPRSMKEHNPELSNLRKDEADRRYEEYQRVLYVGATRAEEHLIVCGGKADSKEETWHEIIGKGLMSLRDRAAYRTVASEDGEIIVYGAENEVCRPSEKDSILTEIKIPPWLSSPVEPEAMNPVIYPSTDDNGEEFEDKRSIPVGTLGSDSRQRGLIIHQLLETLPQYPSDYRSEVAENILASQREMIGAQEYSDILETVFRFLDDDQYKHLFGENSSAEVSVQGEVDGTTISGQIDRLVIEDSKVTIVEFKTTRWIPVAEDDIPRAHRRQVQLYRQLLRPIFPGRTIDAVLIYLAKPVAFWVL